MCEFKTPPIDTIRSQTASTLMIILHGINKRKLGVLGLSLPEYNEENLGDIFRIISFNKNNLIEYIHHPIIQLLIKTQAVTNASIIESVNSKNEIRFIRDRRYDRRRIGHWVNQGYSENEAKERITMLNEIKEPLHFIWMRSNNGNLFKIYIRKESTPNRLDGLFNSYGLSKEGATVPG